MTGIPPRDCEKRNEAAYRRGVAQAITLILRWVDEHPEADPREVLRRAQPIAHRYRFYRDLDRFLLLDELLGEIEKLPKEQLLPRGPHEDV